MASDDITKLTTYLAGTTTINGVFPITVSGSIGCNVVVIPKTPNISEDCYYKCPNGEWFPCFTPSYCCPDGTCGGGDGGTIDCINCVTNTAETSNGYCAFTNSNTGYSNISGYGDQLIVNLNGTGALATPAPSLASYRSTNYCKFKTKTINQIGPGSNINVTSTFISNNNIQTTANGTISYIVDIFGTLTVFTAFLKKVNSTYYWDFSISCGTPVQTNTILNYPVGGSAYTPDFTGMLPAGGGGYNNLLPYSACGSTVPTNGITAGGTATITLSDPVYL
jgi:hypothetical protein